MMSQNIKKIDKLIDDTKNRIEGSINYIKRLYNEIKPPSKKKLTEKEIEEFKKYHKIVNTIDKQFNEIAEKVDEYEKTSENIIDRFKRNILIKIDEAGIHTVARDPLDDVKVIQQRANNIDLANIRRNLTPTNTIFAAVKEYITEYLGIKKKYDDIVIKRLRTKSDQKEGYLDLEKDGTQLQNITNPILQLLLDDVKKYLQWYFFTIIKHLKLKLDEEIMLLTEFRNKNYNIILQQIKRSLKVLINELAIGIEEITAKIISQKNETAESDSDEEDDDDEYKSVLSDEEVEPKVGQQVEPKVGQQVEPIAQSDDVTNIIKKKTKSKRTVLEWILLILLLILVAIGIITFIGIFIAFIYAIVDERRRWKKTGDWKFGRIVLNSLFNWFYIYKYWMTYGIL